MDKILNGLNEKQIEAVTTINGPLQIIAGAGSGKTRVLTHRIAYLIEQGIKPYNILALTFTNKAAREMTNRISKLVEEHNARNIWAGTFHSIFARILRVEAKEIGYDSSFTIYDQESSLKALKVVMKNLNVSKETKEGAVSSVISSAKNQMILPENYAERATTKFEKIVAEIYRSYQAYLKHNNAMDFDDLLLNMLHLLYKPHILAKYQDKYHYILIDEYQDTNKVQYFAIRELAKHRQNICIVGDDAQSIYKWRGADIDNILNFEKDYPYCKTVKLEQNYRSTKTILAAADSVILNNKRQLRKHLWTDNEIGDKVKLLKFNNDREEGKYIIETINRKYTSGEFLNQFVVLYRTNAQSLVFENACRMYNLPYVVVGGFSFFKRKEVNDVLAYLRLLVNPNDDVSLLRIINEPPRGIGAQSIEVLSQLAQHKTLSLLNTLYYAESAPYLRKNTINQITKLVSTFKKHIALNAQNAEPEHLIDYIKETGIIEYYQEIGSEEAEDRLENIEQVINDLMNFLRDGEGRGLQDYLEQISLISDLDAKELSEDRITLMTLHSAKGLEYDNVFIAGLEQNLFPLGIAKMNDEEEEERRLFYVGITRARKRLSLTYAESRMKFGNLQFNPPSIFLKEIEPDLLEDVYNNTFLVSKRHFPNDIGHLDNSIEQQSRPFLSKQNTYKKKSLPAFDDMSYEENYSQIPGEQPVTLKVGDVVQHNSFGIGKIVNVEGIADNRKATIHFASVGRKQILLKYAKLEKIKYKQ